MDVGRTAMANPDYEYALLRHRQIQDLDNLDVYRQNGGFQAFEKAVTFHAAGRGDRSGKGFWIARAWRRRFPHRYEMVFY